jgi:hypothetical protein
MVMDGGTEGVEGGALPHTCPPARGGPEGADAIARWGCLEASVSNLFETPTPAGSSASALVSAMDRYDVDGAGPSHAARCARQVVTALESGGRCCEVVLWGVRGAGKSNPQEMQEMLLD